MGFNVQFTCGPLVDNENVIWLPMEGEVVDHNSNYGPVTLVIFNNNELDAIIKEIKVEPQELMGYFDFKNLIKNKTPKKQTTTFKNIVLTNSKNPNLSGKHPKLTIVFEYEQQATPFSFELGFLIKPFPDFQEILSVDFGNTSTAIVICKPSVPGFGSDCLQAINLDDPLGGESTQSTAIVFMNILNNELKKWKVGEAVKFVFDSYMSFSSGETPINDFEYNNKLRGYKFGGIKKLLGDSETKPYYTYDASSDDNSLIMDGNKLNKYVLEEFLSRTERNTFSETNRLIGRIRGIDNKLNMIVATHPVNYTPNEIKSLAGIWNDLKVPNVDFKYDEATSCAIYYLTKQVFGPNKIAKFWAELETINGLAHIKNQLPVNNLASNVLESEIRFFHMLVFDCGGGTIDIALLRVEIEKQRKRNTKGLLTENYFSIRPCVIGLTGKSDFAGDHMTLAALKLIKIVLLKNIIKFLEGDKNKNKGRIELLESENDDKPIAIKTLKELIDNSGQKSNSELLQISEVNLLCKRALPTHYADLLKNSDKGVGLKQSAEARKLWKDLWDLAETAKKDLATKPNDEKVSVNVTMSILDLFKTNEDNADGTKKSLKDEVSLLSLELSRTELDAMLIENVNLAWEYAADLCSASDLKEINQVVLAGKGSLYPLIKQGIRDTFCYNKSILNKFQYEESKILQNHVDAKFACAKGSAIAKALELTTPADDFNYADQTVISFKPISNQILPYSFCIFDEVLKIYNNVFDRGTKIPENNVLFMIKPDFEMIHILPIFKALKSQGNEVDISNNHVPYCSFKRRTECPDGLILDNLRYCLEINNQLELKCNTFWLDPTDNKKIHEKFAEAVPPEVKSDSNYPHSGQH